MAHTNLKKYGSARAPHQVTVLFRKVEDSNFDHRDTHKLRSYFGWFNGITTQFNVYTDRYGAFLGEAFSPKKTSRFVESLAEFRERMDSKPYEQCPTDQIPDVFQLVAEQVGQQGQAVEQVGQQGQQEEEEEVIQ